MSKNPLRYTYYSLRTWKLYWDRGCRVSPHHFFKN